MSSINTTWEVRLYEVWGNKKDGFEVNDSFVVERAKELRLTKVYNNQGTSRAFTSAYPSDRQIRKIFNINRKKLSLDGDDITIYVNLEKDGYPIGEMHCISHESLSPIRAKNS